MHSLFSDINDITIVNKKLKVKDQVLLFSTVENVDHSKYASKYSYSNCFEILSQAGFLAGMASFGRSYTQTTLHMP